MISLALMLALQAATPAPAANSGPGPLGAIGQQKLPAKGCAAYLWSMDAGRQLVAMATADPAQIRLAIDGKTLDMAVAVRADISAGATVTSATLRIDRPGRDTVVMPVGGLIGCV
jgi:hypothetical protein